MTLSPSDRLDLGDILHRYLAACRLRDNEAALLELFTDDAVLDGPRNYSEGTEGVKEFAAMERGTRSVKPAARTEAAPARSTKVGRMILSNAVVDGDGDDATVQCPWVSISHDPNDESVAPTVRTGSYDCVCKKIDGRWKMQRRVVRIDGLPQFRNTPEYEAGAKWVRKDGDWQLQTG
jgi:SnoaL-like domain